ncbi:hypothetical protein PMIN03_010629 [Paraphaeosphaeria minitans]|uniref:Dpy-30 domain-containing protein n=1 Tax=Paraphaeosphaeria minitans TaxID=565426 RepID=A0A9P6GJQ0_9PLEO|nr:dpy-30 domain-containing protein [Paraphaeosphaeria minitans]
MADPSQQTPQAASAPSPTTVAPIPNGTPAEDVEMAEPTPAPATEQPASTEASSIAPESAPAPTLEPQAQPPPVQQQQHVQPALSAPSPAPALASLRNSPHPSGPAQIPVHATLHGAPTRQYLNQHVTPHLLEAMKHLVTEEPEKPLEYLSKWLAQKSAELEA